MWIASSPSVNLDAATESGDLDCHEIGANCIDLGAVGSLQSNLDDSLYIIGHTADTKAAIDVALTPRVKLQRLLEIILGGRGRTSHRVLKRILGICCRSGRGSIELAEAPII